MDERTMNQTPAYRYSDSHRPVVRLVAKTSLDMEGFAASQPDVVASAASVEDIPIYKGLEYLNDENEYGEYTHNEDAPVLVEFAGRLCYMSFHNPSGRTNEGYIKNIKDMGHFSVLEHGTVTFFVENVDRALTHELIRHRHLSPSELSQRYVDRGDAKAVIPPLFRSDPTLADEYLRAMEANREAYCRLVKLTQRRHPGLKRKQVREAARRVLGEGFETKIVLTGNLRAWREMLTKRYSVAADASILELAEQILEQLKSVYPSLYGDMELQTY